MKDLVIAVIFAVTLQLTFTSAEAAWLIDAERFHVSVHGQLSLEVLDIVQLVQKTLSN